MRKELRGYKSGTTVYARPFVLWMPACACLPLSSVFLVFVFTDTEALMSAVE